MDNVIVIGSGAAGLAAAVAAGHAGARVTVLESTSTIGGTTALSGGVAWVPDNHRAAEIGFEDDREDALTYLRGLSLGDSDDELTDRFVVEGRRVLQGLEDRSPLRWRALAYPDYHAPRPGGRSGGRSVEPDPVIVEAELAARIRRPASWRARVMHSEIILNDIDPEVVAERERTGASTMGGALTAGLLIGAVEAGATIRTDLAVRSLRTSDGRVVGVETGEGSLDGAVVLASGGFERDPAFASAFLRAPITGFTGGPGARGDGLRMALTVGAELGNMSEAWWCPTIRVPGDEIDGEPLSRLILNERARPGSIMVDQRGRRFCNEAQNYNDVGRSLHAFDPGGFRLERDPSWLLFDQAYRERYPVGPVVVEDPDPDWWERAESVASLARLMGVEDRSLVATVERFNEQAARGEDLDFGRGRSVYDRFVGDGSAQHPNLRPIEEPPFFAVPVHAGTLGTKGGPRTDPDARVRSIAGGTIPGLYAAGNAAASPFGMLYPGAGGTIGPALVFGTLAGEAAAVD